MCVEAKCGRRHRIVYMAAGLAGASVEALSHTCWGPGRNYGSGVMDDIIVGSLPASS